MKVLLLFFATTLVGCAGMIQGANEDLQEDLAKRAAFDLECEEEALDFQILESYGNGLVKTFGVRGCGHKATYVRTQTGTWVMNTGPGSDAEKNAD